MGHITVILIELNKLNEVKATYLIRVSYKTAYTLTNKNKDSYNTTCP